MRDTDSFHTFLIMDSAAVNMGVHIALEEADSIFSGYSLRNGISGSYGSSVFNF